MLNKMKKNNNLHIKKKERNKQQNKERLKKIEAMKSIFDSEYNFTQKKNIFPKTSQKRHMYIVVT